jgi:putative membrane protein
MRNLALVLSGFVAVEHVGFFALESFLWTKPLGIKVFKRTEAFMRETAPIAANQGLYNGFLAAGLFWGLWAFGTDPGHAFSLLTFFLGCALVAGVVGAFTASRSILFVQAFPALLALAALWGSR